LRGPRRCGLPIQIGLLVLMLKIVRDFFREDGFFCESQGEDGAHTETV
jgi:hypothetical protein